MPESSPVPNDATETTRYRVAFESCRADIEAVPESELIPITVDVPSMVAMLLGAVPEVKKLEPLLAELKFARPALLQRIEPYALALFHAQAEYIVASRPAVPVADLVAVVTKDRDYLYANAVALEMSGLFDSRTLEEYRGTPGYKTLAVDAYILCNGFRARWADIEGKTPVTLGELDRAEMANEQLLSALGERERAPAAIAAATLRRHKAFTLVAKSWDHIRRCVQYLRWEEGDAETIAPSIYTGRTVRRRNDEADATAPATGAPAGSPATSAPSTPNVLGSFAPPSASGDPIPPGMPGASPFLRE